MANKIRPKMNRTQRAKQFAPFAALKGYEMALRERERILLREGEVKKEKLPILDKKLKLLCPKDMVRITYLKDEDLYVKEGILSYKSDSARLVKIVDTKISYDSIYVIESNVFDGIDFFYD